MGYKVFLIILSLNSATQTHSIQLLLQLMYQSVTMVQQLNAKELLMQYITLIKLKLFL